MTESTLEIVTIVGARPQFIKAAAVSRAIREYSAAESDPALSEAIIHTGQHYDHNMSGTFFSELEIPEPVVNLGISASSHAAITGQMLEALEAELCEREPDIVVIYGDTNTTLAAALAAAKLPCVLAHVEAGLRSFNDQMPEEINRIVADRVSDVLFVPTAAAIDNLRNEGVVESRIHHVGDVMADVARHYGGLADGRLALLEELGLRCGEYALVTAHREDNMTQADRLSGLHSGLCEVAGQMPVVWPMHPRARVALKQAGLLLSLGAAVQLIDPVGYLDMVALEKNARVILTDSGGVQKEAYFYGVPCVVMRDQTEWTELVDAGFNLLAGADPQRIIESFNAALEIRVTTTDLYGDGHAADAIVRHLATASL